MLNGSSPCVKFAFRIGISGNEFLGKPVCTHDPPFVMVAAKNVSFLKRDLIGGGPAIYGLLQVPGGEIAIWRLAAVAIAISLGALLLSEWLVRRQRGGEAD